MLSKTKIKHIQSLKLNKFREHHKTFVAEGSTHVLDLIKSKATVMEVYATESWIHSHKEELKGINFQVVSTSEMKRISFLKNPSEVLALLTITKKQLPKTEGYILALDNIRDPGNLGTIIRTADWFGIRNIVCSPETVDAYNPKVVQATMGSLARVNIHYTDLANYLENSEIPVYGAILNGNDIRKVEKTGKGIFVIGSEAHGISKELFPLINHRIRIPEAKTSGAESLNAAVATAIVCYEFIVINGQK